MRKVDIEKKRERIVRAAAKLFARYGYHKTNLQKIADRLGIAKGSIYGYFKNKKALFVAVCDHTFSALDAELQRFIEQEGNIVKRIRDGTKMFLTFCKRNRHFIDLVVEEHSLLKEHPKFASLVEKQIRRLIEVIERGIEEGLFRRIDPHRAAGALISMVYGALFAYSEKRSPLPLEEMADGILDIYFNGILSKERLR